MLGCKEINALEWGNVEDKLNNETLSSLGQRGDGIVSQMGRFGRFIHNLFIYTFYSFFPNIKKSLVNRPYSPFIYVSFVTYE